MPELPPLEPEDIVYIAIRNQTLMEGAGEEGIIKPTAFHLRKRDVDVPPGDTIGLSMVAAANCPSIEEIKTLTGLKSKVCGIDQIRVGDIQKLGLSVERGKEPWKAYIVGLPYISEEEIDQDDEALGRRDALAAKLASPEVSKKAVRS